MSDPAFRKMYELLSNAVPFGSKPPGVLVVASDGTLIGVYMSSEGAANPHTVTLVEYGSRDYQRFGFILPDGSWDLDRKWNRSGTDVLAAIREFVADPAHAASAQGTKTGKCAFCAGANTGNPPYFHVECARRFGLGDLRLV